MSSLSIKKVSKYLPAIIALSIFLSVASFGMHMSVNGEMPDCPFATGSFSMCGMKVTEHISFWETAFSVIFSETVQMIMSGGLLLIAFFFFANSVKFKLKLERLFYLKRIHIFKVSDYFRLLFSAGILNPKLYNFARISK